MYYEYRIMKGKVVGIVKLLLHANSGWEDVFKNVP